jgi:FkbM family methyltransferase
MNAARWIYPLSLRERIVSRLIARVGRLPRNNGKSHRLLFAPIGLAKLSATDIAHKHIAWAGFYELALSREIAKLARNSGGLLIDVGANAGYFSCLWASIAKNNRCLAFEASPRNVQMLRENVTSAQLASQIGVFDYAVGRSAGQMQFDLGPEDQTGWGGLAITATDNCVTVDVKRLDDLVQSGRMVSVLKIDTEGADAWVLEGAEGLLRQQRIKHVFFECNPTRMRQLGIEGNRPAEILNDCGYQVNELKGTAPGTEYYAIPK